MHDKVTAAGAPSTRQRSGEPVRLKSREFIPTPGMDPAIPSAAPSPRHGLIQFQRIPSRPERVALRRAGVELFNYIPERAFLARLRHLRLVEEVAHAQLRSEGRGSAMQARQALSSE